MDKMIQAEKGEVLITNDGATILGQIQVFWKSVSSEIDCVGSPSRCSHACRIVKGSGY